MQAVTSQCKAVYVRCNYKWVSHYSRIYVQVYKAQSIWFLRSYMRQAICSPHLMDTWTHLVLTSEQREPVHGSNPNQTVLAFGFQYS